LNLLILIFGIFFTFLGWWQLDHFVAPMIWEKKGQKIEIITLPYIGEIEVEYTTFYVLCYISIFIGWSLTMVWLAL